MLLKSRGVLQAYGRRRRPGWAREIGSGEGRRRGWGRAGPGGGAGSDRKRPAERAGRAQSCRASEPASQRELEPHAPARSARFFSTPERDAQGRVSRVLLRPPPTVSILTPSPGVPRALEFRGARGRDWPGHPDSASQELREEGRQPQASRLSSPKIARPASCSLVPPTPPSFGQSFCLCLCLSQPLRLHLPKFCGPGSQAALLLRFSLPFKVLSLLELWSQPPLWEDCG